MQDNRTGPGDKCPHCHWLYNGATCTGCLHCLLSPRVSTKWHAPPIYTTKLNHFVHQFWLVVWEFCFLRFVGTKSMPGRGRKRELESTRNGNMEERPTCLFPPLVLCWRCKYLFWCFPDASHSYRSCALLPLPFGLCDSFDSETTNTSAHTYIMWYIEGESGRGRKEGIRAVGVGTLRNPNLLCFHLLIEVRARFGVSRCLPFLLFLSTPSSSFLACSVALG